MIGRAVSILFRAYRVLLSPAIETAFGIRCRYELSCSRFTEQAIRENGVLKGSWLGLKRILSCSGWHGASRSCHG